MLNSLPVMLDWCSQTATSTIHLITMLWGWHGNYRWAAVTWTRRPHTGFFSYICYFITHFPPFLPFNFFFFFFSPPCLRMSLSSVSPRCQMNHTWSTQPCPWVGIKHPLHHLPPPHPPHLPPPLRVSLAARVRRVRAAQAQTARRSEHIAWLNYRTRCAHK